MLKMYLKYIVTDQTKYLIIVVLENHALSPVGLQKKLS